MKRVALSLFFLFSLQIGFTQKLETLYSDLEKALDQREATAQKKEAHIASIREQIRPGLPLDTLFNRYYKMYEEYLTYRFDSAFHYIDLAERIAQKTGNETQQNLCKISQATLLATSGHFSQSLDLLQKIDRAHIDSTLLPDYYKAFEWVYSVWSEYSNDEYFTPQYKEKEIIYSDSILQVLPPGSNDYYYWLGEYKARTGDQPAAQKAYEKALESLPINTRLYACVTCGLAFAHKRQGNLDDYEKYLILSAISDNICPLKENLSMQELAFHIYLQKKGGLEKANRYLNYAMEDAIFYVNRLRMLEIARKFPAVVNAYQKESQGKSQRLTIAIIAISALMVLVIISLLFIRRQLYQVRSAKRSLDNLNEKLRNLNAELLNTNNTREEYMSLFLELCAAYIEKLNRYQELVRRKVKARQADDLLKQNSTKMSEADAKRFFVNFDTSFITLYPTFLAEFNALLREGEEIYPDKGEILNTELRIFALIRLGITESSSIATLLFYSPQTIYNYRTAVRNRAKNREEFEEQVKKLCPTL